MGWPEKLKLSKQLVNKITGAGFTAPKAIQQKILARIYGGQDIICIGPEGCGKTTTYILAVLNRLKYNADGVPLVLILVPDKEAVLGVISRFYALNANTTASIVGLYAAPGVESQLNALADGADIVVATPDRARAIYLKLGLNLNKIELLIIDDADVIVKQGLQLPVAELANSITKCQRLVFAEVMHGRLNKMISPFMQTAAVVEVEHAAENKIKTVQQVAYHLPNFIAKLNLLNLFVQDGELFTKMVVFVNTRHTAETIYKSLKNQLKNAVGILNSWTVEFNKFTTIDDFKNSLPARVLIVVDEAGNEAGLLDIPFFVHFELPPQRGLFISRVAKNTGDAKTEQTMAITFVTDHELSQLKKIEQAIGQMLPFAELPEKLAIEKDKKEIVAKGKNIAKNSITAPITGRAFHEKKASNSKTFNYGSGAKAKMNNKRKHGSGER